jgi:SAM-dependent methyltransferase
VEEGVYAEHYEQEDRHWWFRGKRAVIWALVQQVELPEKARVLDAGCGTGRNLVEFGALGATAGVDPSPDAVAFCHRRGLDSVRLGGLEALPFGGGEFDLLLASDVLEHVQDDHGALVELRRVAADGASLVITVPAYEWMWSEHDDQMHHVRRYTLRRLRHRVLAAGWRPVHSTYFNSILLPVVAAARLATRLLPLSGRTDIGRTPPVLNSALEAPMRLEAAMIGRGARLPAGVSVGMVCQRDPTGLT